MIRSLTAGVLVVGMLAGGATFAQEPRGGRPGGPGRAGGASTALRAERGMMGGLPIAALNLTQAQQDLVRDIRERSREEARQLEAKVREAQAAQRKAVDAIPLNEGLIRATTLAVAEAQAEVAIQQARIQNEIFAALTPAQQEQVKKTQAEREQRLEQRRPKR